jgi:pyruvate/2-oxoglutarate/acetoin dehydrogenase E1 component
MEEKKMAEVRYWKAINSALEEEMERDDRVFLMGEDIGVWGGSFGVTRGLVEKFGEKRVKDTPISETAITGGGIGAAIAGLRPVIEIMFSDFLFVTMDEIVSIAAKWRYVHGSQFPCPLVIRTAMGGYLSAGILHSQCPTVHFFHTPGIKIAVPSTAADAKGLLKTAIRDDNPVLYFEHKGLYGTKGEVPDGDFTIPFGVADVKKDGKDVTIVAISLMVQFSLKVAQELEKEGINAEVIDPRTLEPLDIETILKSVKKTGRAVLVDEANIRGSVTAEIGMQIMENALSALKAPIKRVGAANVPIPCAPVLEKAVLPSVESIKKAVKEVIG